MISGAGMTDRGEGADSGPTIQLVTLHAAGQYLGLPIDRVRDVFLVSDMTRVPKAPRAIAGLVNLRGRIVTMLSLGALLDRPDTSGSGETTAVGVEWHGESFGLTIESVGEVLTLPAGGREPNPSHLDPALAAVSAGVHRLADRLLVEINLERLLDTPFREAA
jgi:purine-binding chemotaxis protein CheW